MISAYELLSQALGNKLTHILITIYKQPGCFDIAYQALQLSMQSIHTSTHTRPIMGPIPGLKKKHSERHAK